MKQRSLEEAIYCQKGLEEISMYNTVMFYRRELEKIQGGTSATELFTTNQRQRLNRQGVFTTIHEGGAGRKTIITEETKWYLEREGEDG